MSGHPKPAPRRTIGVYLSDATDELLPWLRSVAEDQARRHPGRRISIAGVAKEALELVRRNPDLESQLRR